MRRAAAALAAVLFVAAPDVSLAQGRVGVAATVEHARITEDDGYLGAGFGGAGSLQFYVTEATSVEVEIGAERHVRDLSLFAVALDPQGRPHAAPYTERWEGTAKFVLGLVSHAFGSGRARPVVWGGVGRMWHGGTSRGPLTQPQVPPGLTLQPGDAEARQGRSSEAIAIDGGFGVDVRAADRVTLRPFAGLRLVGTGNYGPKYVVRFGGRIGFRW